MKLINDKYTTILVEEEEEKITVNDIWYITRTHTYMTTITYIYIYMIIN